MASHSNPECKATLQKANLLLVDDQRSNLIALEAVLSSPEYNLILAQSGLEALELVKQHDIALVLLDVQMPGLDGFETARRMKAIEGCRDIPIIFITAVYTEDPFIKKGYEVGAIDYFSKPFDPETLKLKVGLYSAFRQKTPPHSREGTTHQGNRRASDNRPKAICCVGEPSSGGFHRRR